MPTTKTQWFPALDGLRAVAVLLVLVEHWAFFLIRDLSPLVRPGRLGVQLFFVISGFLITRIILNALESTDRNSASRRLFLRSFYARRFLRIFPLYYSVLIIAWALDVPDIRNNALWHFTYTTNIHDSLYGGAGLSSHFWSLCVEEQFYLFWPPAILFFSTCRGLPTIVVALFLYPTVFLSLSIAGYDQYLLTLSPFGSLHTLCGGALLAWISLNAVGSTLFRILRHPLWLASTFAAYTAFVVFGNDNSRALYLTHHTLLALFLIATVASATDTSPTRLGDTLKNPVLAYLGRISYGIYVIHPFAPGIVRWAFTQADMNGTEVLGKLQLPAYFAVTVGIASASWYLMESPINRLKSRFPYSVLARENQTILSALDSSTEGSVPDFPIPNHHS